MDKNYYKSYYTLERSNWWFLIRSKIIRQSIVRNLQNPNSLKILNLGVATGATSDMLSEFGEVNSSEYDKNTCDFLEKELGMKVIHASITDLPFESDSFDLVCAFDVIEHVQDDKLAYQEMKRVCKNTGHIITTVPAYMSLWSPHDVINQHYRRYTKNEILKQTEDINLKPVYYSYFNSILFLPIFIIRKVSSWRKQVMSESDFDKANSKIANFVFKKIFGLELTLLKYVKFPFGVSFIHISKVVK